MFHFGEEEEAMKNSLKKLRGFVPHMHDVKDRRNVPLPLAQLDELAQATQDMVDMRDCYDTLLSAAAATANSAYEFSQSLHEMGACLLEKTALNDDEESGKVLLMLGKVQFELQRLVDSYRSHISQTITIPSESLLNELRTVEVMKRQCDEKRIVYEDMIRRQKEKGRSRSGKSENVSSQKLRMAHEEYEEEATLFVFRLKSLKQGQSRSLLTQAARHHAAQLSFFRKSLKSLETVEPHVKSVTEQQHIDYQFSGLEDYDDSEGEDDDDDDDSGDAQDDGELSFDYGQNDQAQDVVSTPGNSMELDQGDLTFPLVTITEAAKENLYKVHGDAFANSGEIRAGSQSAPLFAEKKVDPAERLRQMRPSSSRKLHTYVLPTPSDTNSSISTGSGNPVTRNMWHSSPLELKKGDEKISGPNVSKAQSVLKESNNNTAPTRLPPPLTEGLSFARRDPRTYSDNKKIKRYAFSGPLTSKPWSTKPVSSGSAPFASVEHPQLFSGPLLRTPIPHPPPSSSSPKVSPRTSPPFLSPPKIRELHELPRPPAGSTSAYTRPSGLVGHSAPIVRGQVLPSTNRSKPSNAAASPLPTPPQAVTRSFSIPSRAPRGTALHVSKKMEAPQISEMSEDVSSPPLTPISLPNMQPASTTETVTQDTQIRGAD